MVESCLHDFIAQRNAIEFVPWHAKQTWMPVSIVIGYQFARRELGRMMVYWLIAGLSINVASTLHRVFWRWAIGHDLPVLDLYPRDLELLVRYVPIDCLIGIRTAHHSVIYDVAKCNVCEH